MKNDERVIEEVKTAKSMGFTIFWFGIFAVLVYRWMVLGQSFTENLDFFLIWFIASLTQFIFLAVRGIPITYPISMKEKEQRYYMYLVPFLTGTLSAVLVFFRVGLDLRRIFGGFAFTFFSTFLLFSLYKLILYFWEKRNL